MIQLFYLSYLIVLDGLVLESPKPELPRIQNCVGLTHQSAYSASRHRRSTLLLWCTSRGRVQVDRESDDQVPRTAR